MKKVTEILKNPKMEIGYLYFYIHLITEIVCFFTLSRVIGDMLILWIIPFLYDALAFVPQSLIGYISDKFPKLKIGLIGNILLTLGLILTSTNIVTIYIGITLLSLGNAFIHIAGGIDTLKISNGSLSPSAIFVSGGSFGVILGKIIGKTKITFWLIALLSLTTIPFILLSSILKEENNVKEPCKNFNYTNDKIKPAIIIIGAVIIVIIRGYMGYGLPVSWNKTLFQSVLLYFTMGLGKALGGILSDIYGMKKIATISIIASLPFLLIGNNLMIISLTGVMLFSMTMSITLGIIVSVLKKTPGLAFGLTTIGLFLGTVPIFFFKITNTLLNNTIIIILSIICILIARKIIKEGET
ncbi:MAG: MFS transporter [Bacilli bacterium]|nr:MFS transporter [Bacilli bacterium]